MRYYAIVRHVLKPQKTKRNHRNERSDRNDQTDITKTNETTKTRWPKLAKPNHQNKQKHRNDGNKGLNLRSFSFSGFFSLFGGFSTSPVVPISHPTGEQDSCFAHSDKLQLAVQVYQVRFTERVKLKCRDKRSKQLNWSGAQISLHCSLGLNFDGRCRTRSGQQLNQSVVMK